MQKIIAREGIASRRHAEQLIASGQVTVNGRVVSEMGMKADASRDHIKVKGKLLRLIEHKKIYLALNKPAGMVSTLQDPEGRSSLRELLHGVPERVYPAGRLEYHASGLLLLTNDGELANRIIRCHGLPQVWMLKVKGRLGSEEFRKITEATGLRLERRRQGENAWYEVQFTGTPLESLRRVLGAMGHPVEKMHRIAISGVELGSLPARRHRELTEEEVKRLWRTLNRPRGASTQPMAAHKERWKPVRPGSNPALPLKFESRRITAPS
ncbi:MAG: pseudouridine synthase [Candidatus Acidiferrales bacterium]